MRTLLIDADTLVYEACTGNEAEVEWEPWLWTLHCDVDAAKEQFKQDPHFSHDQFIPYAREMALKLIPLAGAWMAIRLSKKAHHKPLLEAVPQTLDRENEGLQKAFGTDDFCEALKARSGKKSPALRER